MQRRLLIIDDEDELREILQLNLRKLGIDIKLAVNGKQALEMAGAETFHAILTDLSMPVMDGLMFLSYLRASGSETPVVVLSAHDNKPNMLKALQCGAYDFLEKPYEPDVLLETISKALELGWRQNQLVELINGAVSSQEKIEEIQKQRKMVGLLKAARHRNAV